MQTTPRVAQIFTPGRLSLTPVDAVRICPVCIAQASLIGRTVVLRYVNHCPFHHVAFVNQCPCGSPLILFAQGHPPFTCFFCGLHWAHLPRIPIPHHLISFERDLFMLYALFLQNGTTTLKYRALRMARQFAQKKYGMDFSLIHSKQKYMPNIHMSTLSLGSVVDLLVSVGITPHDISQDQ